MRIYAEDTMLLVVDLQEKLVPVIEYGYDIVENVIKLIKGIKLLDVPTIVTQQYTKGLGMTVDAVKDEFDAPFIYQDKLTFSCGGDEIILEQIKNLNKNNIIICGIETHICVLQTAIDLLEMGYNVILVENCIGSRKEEDKRIAIQRAVAEGAIITTYEAILFELTKVAGTEQFKLISKLIK
jgi:Amidases related to nicotinamidase